MRSVILALLLLLGATANAQRAHHKGGIDIVDPDDYVYTRAQIANARIPNLLIFRTAETDLKDNGDGWLTFTYETDLANRSLRQIAEVDVALAVTKDGTTQDVFRSKPVAFKSFHNLRIPHVGALEGWTTLDTFISGKFKIPAEVWTTDVNLHLVITRIVPVRNESNLHNIGNLISFMQFQRTADIERAILRDPSIVKAHNSVGTNACLVAVAQGTTRLINFVIAHGGNLNAKGGGKDAMFFAAVSNRPKNLDFVLQHGFKPNTVHKPDGLTPLHLCVIDYTNSSIRWFIHHGADINKNDSDGRPPIMDAILHGNVLAFNILFESGAKVRVYDNNGYSLMDYAVGRPQFLPMVHAAGMGIDERDRRMMKTPLMYAAMSQNYEGARWLLDHGANLNARDIEGKNVLAYARMSNTLRSDMFFRRAIGDLTKYGGK